MLCWPKSDPLHRTIYNVFEACFYELGRQSLQILRAEHRSDVDSRSLGVIRYEEYLFFSFHILTSNALFVIQTVPKTTKACRYSFPNPPNHADAIYCPTHFAFAGDFNPTDGHDTQLYAQRNKDPIYFYHLPRSPRLPLSNQHSPTVVRGHRGP